MCQPLNRGYCRRLLGQLTQSDHLAIGALAQIAPYPSIDAFGPARHRNEIETRRMGVIYRLKRINLEPVKALVAAHHRYRAHYLAFSSQCQNMKLLISCKRFPPRAKPCMRKKQTFHARPGNQAIPFAGECIESLEIRDRFDLKVLFGYFLCMCEDLLFDHTSFFPVTK